MYTLNCRGHLLSVERPLVMGILNITPDSFYAGSRGMQMDDILRRVETMVQEGADMVDIGGQSTRPGSGLVMADEELSRVAEPIAVIHRQFPGLILSVDTFYARVAMESIAAGASLVNDVSAGEMDPDLIPAVGRAGVPYILMHMQGTPQSMQDNPVYQNVVTDVLDFLVKKIEVCRLAGIRDIIVDPGFGFGKTIAHNFALLQQLDLLQRTGRPILAGLSRKSTVWKTLAVGPDEALNGSTVLHTIALLRGASILRVHDVRAAREAVILFSAMHESGS